jgi:hypothetical protein
MQNYDGDGHEESRRAFLRRGGGILSAVWITANWPAIAAAAHEAEAAQAAPERFEFFSAADAADVAAICTQIVPSGATPGASEAHAVYFIDRALASFLARWAGGCRSGLADFQANFRAAHPTSFAAASPEQQIAYLKTVDSAPFFEDIRTLTVLGMFCSPKYGGNYGGIGWRLLGFEDRHAFTPPFGYYDREYPGFVPYDSGARS